ncbi:MAG: thioesterase family protein, partial [Alphaproteobacteria bacterium]|nr:thioesterase family protein [Alphaproteobacteria bacterium]
MSMSPMTPPHIASIHHGTVLPDWIDYNGHMNLAYYLVAFDQASDGFTDFIGLDRPYRAAHDSTIFVVEAHLTYARELVEAEAFRIETRVLGVDGRKLRLFQAMYRAGETEIAATNELMILHVDMRTRRSAP